MKLIDKIDTCTLHQSDEQYIMTGNTGTHKLWIHSTNDERLQAHWKGFVDNNREYISIIFSRRIHVFEDDPPTAKGIWEQTTSGICNALVAADHMMTSQFLQHKPKHISDELELLSTIPADALSDALMVYNRIDLSRIEIVFETVSTIDSTGQWRTASIEFRDGDEWISNSLSIRETLMAEVNAHE